MFPTLIKSKIGKHGGTWANLQILLKIAGNIDKAIEATVYKTFIENNILGVRDTGGEASKELNALIDTLPDRIKKNKSNKGCYIQISKAIRDKLEILNSKGYNEEEHDMKVQEVRKEIVKTSCNLIRMKMITSYPQLKDFISSYPI